jgi:Cys-tRNA(Pro) deacylase
MKIGRGQALILRLLDLKIEMSSSELATFLRIHHVQAQILRFGSHTRTVTDAARQLRVGRERIIKSMLLIDENGRPILAIVTGDKKVDKEKLAEILNVKRTKMSDAKEVARLTGYEGGALPPVGHKIQLRTVMDAKVMTFKTVFGGGGEENCLLEIYPHDIKKLANAEVGDIGKA